MMKGSERGGAIINLQQCAGVSLGAQHVFA
jgi:hypothetical protein